MVPNGYVPIGRFTSRTQSFNLYQRILKRTGMKCDNCGKKQTIATVQVSRYRDDGVSHHEFWCLECVQGKNQVRSRYDLT